MRPAVSTSKAVLPLWDMLHCEHCFTVVYPRLPAQFAHYHLHNELLVDEKLAPAGAAATTRAPHTRSAARQEGSTLRLDWSESGQARPPLADAVAPRLRGGTSDQRAARAHPHSDRHEGGCLPCEKGGRYASLGGPVVDTPMLHARVGMGDGYDGRSPAARGPSATQVESLPGDLALSPSRPTTLPSPGLTVPGGDRR